MNNQPYIQNDFLQKIETLVSNETSNSFSNNEIKSEIYSAYTALMNKSILDDPLLTEVDEFGLLCARHKINISQIFAVHKEFLEENKPTDETSQQMFSANLAAFVFKYCNTLLDWMSLMDSDKSEIANGSLKFEGTDLELNQFKFDTQEQIALLDSLIVDFEKDSNDKEILDRSFRVVHTIKGNAGLIKHKRMVDLAHAMETVFDNLRKEKIQATPQLINTLYYVSDALKTLTQELESKSPLVPDLNVMLQTLNKYLDLKKVTNSKFDFDEIMDQKGIEIKISGLPEEIEMYTEICETNLNSVKTIMKKINPTMDESDFTESLTLLIEQIYQIKGDSEMVGHQRLIKFLNYFIRVLNKTHNKTIEYTESIQKLFNQSIEIIEKLIPEVKTKHQSGVTITNLLKEMYEVLNPNEITTPVEQTPEKPSAQTIGKIESDDMAEKKTKTKSESIKVDLNYIIQLNKSVGVLLSNNKDLEQSIENIYHSASLDFSISELKKHHKKNVITIESIQQNLERLLLIPIANVLSPYHRMVRDVSLQLNKKVNLIIEGSEIEIDKQIGEVLHTPMTHLLRNAIDHGIENPKEREENGKPPQGTITISAYHSNNKINIDITDDGKGIDVNRIKEKLITQEILTEEKLSQLSEDRILNYIFLPGMSTASKVSDISGRGVGMDIVRDSLESINGRITIKSTQGKGTTFTIMLSNKFAEGIVFQSKNNLYLIPMGYIVGFHSPLTSEISYITNQGMVINYQGTYVTLYDLTTSKRIVNLSTESIETVIIVKENDQLLGLVIDEVVGKHQAVIRDLKEILKNIPGLLGVAVLGTGEITNIVDVAYHIQHSQVQSEELEPAL